MSDQMIAVVIILIGFLLLGLSSMLIVIGFKALLA